MPSDASTYALKRKNPASMKMYEPTNHSANCGFAFFVRCVAMTVAQVKTT